jgi:hypothetical protein
MRSRLPRYSWIVTCEPHCFKNPEQQRGCHVLGYESNRRMKGIRMSVKREAVIVSAARTPLGSFGGTLSGFGTMLGG